MNKIKEYRTCHGLTQKELAQKLKIDRSSVAKWESDENTPRLKYLLALSKIFQCSIEELIANGRVDIERLCFRIPKENCRNKGGLRKYSHH